jgi:redox-sensitive bicupin YhaK (pirin superfamily)
MQNLVNYLFRAAIIYLVVCTVAAECKESVMAYKIRKSGERKFYDHGWLKTYHTFSFASYYDPNFMGFRKLRVINEDRVAPGQGFPTHAHEDMEIITVVLEGELAHKDSMGHETIIHAGELQAMSAGSGISHSEYNPSKSQPVHLLQIWIEPDAKGIKPGYQRQMQLPKTPNQWTLLASKDGRDNSVKIHQDVNLYAIALEPGTKTLPSSRYGWLQVMDGEVQIDGNTLRTGDGAAIDPNTSLTLKTISPTRLLFFDLN